MQAALNEQAYAKAVALYMALELSSKAWKLGFSDGGRTRVVTVDSGDREAVLAAVAQAKQRFGLAAQAPVYSGYEAGRDGFWIHRWLVSVGVNNTVMDASSIEVSRRARRAKSDRLDVTKLLDLLLRYGRGERRAFSAVRVPDEAAEDARRLHRERGRLMKERNAHRNRLGSLLVTQGVVVKLGKGFGERLKTLRRWDGVPLPASLGAELQREWSRLVAVDEQLRGLALEQRRQLCSEPPADDNAVRQMQQLLALKAVGPQSAWQLVRELFGWRRFANRRQLAGCVGLTPTPYNSGTLQHEQGISKAGNRRMRALLVELAWMWLRHQPGSELSRWYEQRFAHGSKRQRRIGIVALARKLLVALWRYLEYGELPAGAVLKTA